MATGVVVAILIIFIFFIPGQYGKSVSNIYFVPAGTFSPFHGIVPDETGDAGGRAVITVDPLPEHLTGEIVTVSGTTTLPAGEVLDIAVIQEPYHSTKCEPGTFCGSAMYSITVSSGQPMNVWTFRLNTSGFFEGTYDIWIVAKSSPETLVHTGMTLREENTNSFPDQWD